MKTSKLLNHDEPFEVMPGCPTLTFVLKEAEHMLPYQSFQSAVFQKEQIELTFSAGVFTIQGKCLESLWRHFQLLDIRKIKCLQGSDPEEPTIISIEWEEATDDE